MIRLAACALLITSPAWGQNCGPRAAIIATLGAKYQEAPKSRAMFSNGAAVFEFWEAEDGATFTLLATFPDGRSCIVAAGIDKHDVEADAKGESL